RIKAGRGRLNWGSCLTDTTHGSRARLTVRVFAAMLRSERLYNNRCGLLTSCNHIDFRARKVARRSWTNEIRLSSKHKANGHLLQCCYRVGVVFLPTTVGLASGETTARRRGCAGAVAALPD